MKDVSTMVALIATVTLLSCTPEPPGEVVVTPDMEKGLLAGFDRIILLQNQCADIQSFIDCHTTQAQAAMAALDPFVDPGLLDPSKSDVMSNRGALWVCLVARQSGFTRDRTTVERHVIDPRNKLARVIFSIDGYNFGFPMARQDGTWRSPFPGQVMLATQYESWMSTLKAGVSKKNHVRLDEMLAQTMKTLNGYQPNWSMYPELGQKETDELQLMIRERLWKQANEADKAAGPVSN